MSVVKGLISLFGYQEFTVFPFSKVLYSIIYFSSFLLLDFSLKLYLFMIIFRSIVMLVIAIKRFITNTLNKTLIN